MSNCEIQNSCWSLVSEETKSLFFQHDQQKHKWCDKLFFPAKTNIDCNSHAKEQNKSFLQNDNVDATTTARDKSSVSIKLPHHVFIADQTLYTALRIHPSEELLLAATKSKATAWPWLLTSRSIFLNRDTLAICDIGNWNNVNG